MPAKAFLLAVTVMVFLMTATAALRAQSNDGNLLPNGDFELGALEMGAPPDKWSFAIDSGTKVNGGMTTTFQRSGARSVVFRSPTKPTDKWQALTYNTPVKEGLTYEFSVWVHYDPSDPLMGDASGKISIEWKDATDQEIERVMSEPWTGKKLGQSGGWSEVKIKALAPAGARRASFVITYFRGKQTHSGGSFMVDDAVVKAVEVPK